MSLFQHSVDLNENEEQPTRNGAIDDDDLHKKEEDKMEDLSLTIVEFNEDDEEEGGKFPPTANTNSNYDRNAPHLKFRQGKDITASTKTDMVHDLIIDGQNSCGRKNINISGATFSSPSVLTKHPVVYQSNGELIPTTFTDIIKGSLNTSTTTAHEKQFRKFMLKINKAMDEHEEIMILYYNTKLAAISKEEDMNRKNVMNHHETKGHALQEIFSHQRNVLKDRLLNRQREAKRRKDSDFCIEQLRNVIDEMKKDLREVDDPELKEFYCKMLKKSFTKA